MSESSYTAWDDKLYQWPPPDGWYQAGDGKWWPEGYGPGPDAPAASDPAASVDEATAETGDASVDETPTDHMSDRAGDDPEDVGAALAETLGVRRPAEVADTIDDHRDDPDATMIDVGSGVDTGLGSVDDAAGLSGDLGSGADAGLGSVDDAAATTALDVDGADIDERIDAVADGLAGAVAHFGDPDVGSDIGQRTDLDARSSPSVGASPETSGSGAEPPSLFSRADETLVAPSVEPGSLFESAPSPRPEPADRPTSWADEGGFATDVAATTGSWNQADYAPPPPTRPAGSGAGRGGVSRILLPVALGVATLVALGVLAFLLFGGGEDDLEPITGIGSFSEPHPRANGVEIFYPVGDEEQRWVIEVVEPVGDASAEANIPIEAGQSLAATTVRIQNLNPNASGLLGQLQFNAVTATGEVVVGDTAGCQQLDGGLDLAASIPPSGVADGVLCWVVAAPDVAGLLLGVESTEVPGRIHIQLQ